MGQSKHSGKLEGHSCPVGSERVRRGDVSQSLGGGLDMFQHLPVEVLRHIYEFDATYHQIFAIVQRELVVYVHLHDEFTNSYTEILQHPWLLRNFTKDDLLRFFNCTRLRNFSLRRKACDKITRKRLLRKLFCLYLPLGHSLHLDDTWILS